MRRGSYNYRTGEAFDTHGVLLGRFDDNKAAEAAMYAARLPAKFWVSQDVPPIPLLQQLNGWVIKQNERRLPKWKFRFAANLAVQIQSRITRAHDLLFEGHALQMEGVTAKFFVKPKELHDQHYWRMKFKLFANLPNANAWTLKPTSAERGRLCPASGLVELRQAVIKALHPDRFTSLHPDLMLSTQCLCCGKGLTDPVSMARWIGPECWGSASTNLPHIFKAMAMEAA